jgi:Zn-dependent protease with chaperone function
MRRTHFAPAAMLASLAILGPLSSPGVAQTIRQPQPGFNLFSVQQDVEIGRQSAIEAERQLKLLNDRVTNNYLTRIVTRLAAETPGARYPYTVKAVNAEEINAFALPGGPMYVNRGLIEAARTEAELAGVLAHEMSHVALRHGTHQASKAYLAQGGLGLLGGIFGKPGGTSGQVLNAIGGVGLNAVFLKFSRDDEYQADLVGAQTMFRAGYDPRAMATLFELLQAKQGSEPGKLAQFFSSHPPAADRGQRIRNLAASLGTGSTQLVGNFDNVKLRLQRLGSAPAQVITQSSGAVVNDPTTQPVTITVAPPSARYARYSHPTGFFTVDFPNNWRAYSSGTAVTIAPDGGMVVAPTGRQTLHYGVILNHYAPFEGDNDRWAASLQRNYAPFENRTNPPRAYLEDATDDLVRTILSSNTHLRAEVGSARAETIDGEAAFSVMLTGRSPETGEDESVTVFTRGLTDGHVIYAVAVVPTRDAAALAPTFARMMQTLRVNDEAAHRASPTSNSVRVIP